MKTLLSCLAALVAAGALLPAAAHAAEEIETTRRDALVLYGDLDLSREADARQLLGRIGRAGTKVCRFEGEKVINREVARCRREAISRAVSDVRAPTLTAVYRGARSLQLAGL
jgi:UrcA family protein